METYIDIPTIIIMLRLTSIESFTKTCNSSSRLKVACTKPLNLFMELSRCLCLESSEIMSKSRSHPWIWLCDKPKSWSLTILLKSTELLLKSLM